MRRLLAALLVLGTLAPANAATDPRLVHVGLYRAWSGLAEPLAMAHPGGDTHRLFVVERAGRIRVIRDGVLKATPFLDIRPKVNTAGEGGLLGLAFRPDYATSGYFYVTFTDADMTLHLSRFHAKPASDVADPVGAAVLLVPHPGATNHNGGQVVFGPGGLLFLGTGDGGGGGDPSGNAQNTHVLLGKVLRIDVKNKPAGQTYGIPSGNPYATATDGKRREIWLVGLRNPWRFSFDRVTRHLWVGDVGQGDREEVDHLGTTGGANLGWDCREGTLNTASTYGGSYCATTGYTGPYWDYDHSLGCAIIGGYVYRGTTYSALLGGTYVFADYCSGRIWGLGHDTNGRQVVSELSRLNASVLAFGEAESGELYLLAGNGTIYRVGATHR